MVAAEPIYSDNERRTFLADWLKQSVMVKGVLERIDTHKNPKSPFVIALAQDVEITLPTAARHNIGHLWIQRAEPMRHLHPGDRFGCRCTVHTYTKSADPGHPYYGLKYPSEVQRLPDPIALRTEQPPPAALPNGRAPPQPIDPLDLLLKASEVVHKAGGPQQLMALQELVGAMGGWDAVLDIQAFIEDLGGWERMQKLLTLLKC
jgi:hypothetical protein